MCGNYVPEHFDKYVVKKAGTTLLYHFIPVNNVISIIFYVHISTMLRTTETSNGHQLWKFKQH